MNYDKKPNLIAISNFMKNCTEQYFKHKGFTVECKYIYNGIDMKKYKYYKDDRYLIDNKEIRKTDRLLYVGRYSKFKQPHIAIEVAKKVGLPIDLVGGTFVDDIGYLKDIESICNGKNIIMYKDVPHDFKIRKMQEAKALLFPSAMGEPYGLVAVEAMACGTPVIASNDGAISEVVIHNKTGFICNSIEEMIDSVNKIDKINPEDCRKRAEELSRQNMAKNYENLYYKMLKGEEW